MNPSTKRILTLILLVLVPLGGCIGGFVLASPQQKGYSLGAPPEPAVKIYSANNLGVVVQTQSGAYYVCYFLGESQQASQNCWQKVDAPSPGKNAVNEPQLDAARYAPPPAQIRDFWIASSFDDIGGFIHETRYALLEDGRVWIWNDDVNTFLNFPMIVGQMLGALLGLFCIGGLGFLIWGLVAIIAPRIKPTAS